MVKEEIKFGTEMHEFKLNETVEGVLKEVKEDVGQHKNNVYTVGDKTFWGSKELNILLESVKVGQQVFITLVDENYKFPNGRVGRHFRVEVEK